MKLQLKDSHYQVITKSLPAIALLTINGFLRYYKDSFDKVTTAANNSLDILITNLILPESQ